MVFHLLTDPAHWRQRRSDAIGSARECREALTRPDGYWRYAADDQRVKDAVGKWVARARHAHAIAMGRLPVIPNFVCVTGSGVASGHLYARAS